MAPLTMAQRRRNALKGWKRQREREEKRRREDLEPFAAYLARPITYNLALDLDLAPFDDKDERP